MRESPPIISIMRLYQRGYMPKRLGLTGMPWVFKKIDAATFAQNDLRKSMTVMMTQSKEWITKKKVSMMSVNPSIADELAKYEKQLSAIESDIASGKIKNLADVRTHHGNVIDTRSKKMTKSKNLLNSIDGQKACLDVIRNDVDTKAKEVQKLQSDAKQKMQDYDTQIKADPKKATALRQEAAGYINDANKKILQLEQATGANLAHLRTTNVSVYNEMIASNPLAKKLSVMNDGFESVTKL